MAIFVGVMSIVSITVDVYQSHKQELSIREFAEEILELVPGTKSKISYHPLPEDDPKQRKLDISLANKLLSWEPKVNRSEGLAMTYEYFKKVVV